MFKSDCFMSVVFTTGQLIRVATVTRTKNTGSYWRQYTVKTELRIGDYLVEKPVILIFQNFMETV